MSIGDVAWNGIGASKSRASCPKPRAILTKMQAIEIFQRSLQSSQGTHRGKAASASGVAREYRISEKAVRDIWTARTWSDETLHLEPNRKIRKVQPTGRPPGRRDSAPRRRQGENVGRGMPRAKRSSGAGQQLDKSDTSNTSCESSSTKDDRIIDDAHEYLGLGARRGGVSLGVGAMLSVEDQTKPVAGPSGMFGGPGDAVCGIGSMLRTVNSIHARSIAHATSGSSCLLGGIMGDGSCPWPRWPPVPLCPLLSQLASAAPTLGRATLTGEWMPSPPLAAEVAAGPFWPQPAFGAGLVAGPGAGAWIPSTATVAGWAAAQCTASQAREMCGEVGLVGYSSPSWNGGVLGVGLVGGLGSGSMVCVGLGCGLGLGAGGGTGRAGSCVFGDVAMDVGDSVGRGGMGGFGCGIGGFAGRVG